MNLNKIKIGILGGGQLGKMLCLAAANWDLEIYILENDENCPAAPYCSRLVKGNFNDFNDVLNFGKMVDILTIEIEHVNTEALKTLANEGKIVHPNPISLDIIKDKGEQKNFYINHNFPTSFVRYYDDKSTLKKEIIEDKWLPCVWKSRKGGYDGKGVSILKTVADIDILPDEPCIIEEMVDIDKEIAIIVCQNEKGEVVAYPSVEMVFDAKANLLDYQLCPANIEKNIEKKAQTLAKRLIKKLNICGLLAVEMFITKSGEILINEVAPRPHNSGHHTIEAIETSQFEQHLRGIMNLPLGSTNMRHPSVLLNLVGAEDYSGDVEIEGWENALNTEGCHIHLYGKKTTKPFRKMGHATFLNKNIGKALENAQYLKENFKIKSNG